MVAASEARTATLSALTVEFSMSASVVLVTTLAASVAAPAAAENAMPPAKL